MENWVCLTINAAFKHGKIPVVENEIRKIFGSDLRDIQTVRNEALIASGGYYCLVLCSDYFAHVSDLKLLVPDICVIDSVDSPRWLTNREVKDFVQSSDLSKATPIVRNGDIVLVSEGYLQNLYGLVCGTSGTKGQRCRISFKTHLRTFTETVAAKSLKIVGNFFQKKKFPVQNKDIRDDIGIGNIYRQKHRKRVQPKDC
jgi:hypothetical protein